MLRYGPEFAGEKIYIGNNEESVKVWNSAKRWCSTSENIKIKIFQLLHLLVSYDQVGDVVDGSEAEAIRHADLPVQFMIIVQISL